MTKNKVLSLFLFLSVSFALSSCAKKGCTDKNAANYESGATRDDGTCTYKGSVVFWYDAACSASLGADGATSLTYYVDGQIVGSSAASVFWTGAPDCGQAASITVEKDLGFSKTKTYSFSVEDQDGVEIWSGSVNFEGNTCLKQQLTY